MPLNKSGIFLRSVFSTRACSAFMRCTNLGQNVRMDRKRMKKYSIKKVENDRNYD